MTRVRLVQADADSNIMAFRIADGVFDGQLCADYLTSYLADPAQRLILALSGELIVGQLKSVVHRHPDKAPNLFVEELGVADDWQRRGIGTRLLRRAAALARTLGCAELWLATEPENMPANGLYRAAGLKGQHVVMYSRYIRQTRD